MILRILALALPLLLAGCLDFSPAASGSTTDGRVGVRCVPTDETLVEWAAPGGPDAVSVTLPFVLVQGATRLDVEWTPPSTFAGSYLATITDPRGEEIFSRAQSQGVGAPGSTISIGGGGRNVDRHVTPPPAGDYVFRVESDGVFEDARMVIAASGCY